MIDMNNIANAARSVLPSDPPATIAFAICQLRGLDPWQMPPANYFGLVNWQVVIAEQLLQAELRQSIGPRPGAGGAGVVPGESIGQRHG